MCILLVFGTSAMMINHHAGRDRNGFAASYLYHHLVAKFSVTVIVGIYGASSIVQLTCLSECFLFFSTRNRIWNWRFRKSENKKFCVGGGRGIARKRIVTSKFSHSAPRFKKLKNRFFCVSALRFQHAAPAIPV